MNKNNMFKCLHCGNIQHTTEFGECAECGYEDLTELVTVLSKDRKREGKAYRNPESYVFDGNIITIFWSIEWDDGEIAVVSQEEMKQIDENTYIKL